MISLNFKQTSLKKRSLLAALVSLTLFIPLAAITLEQAFVSSLTQSMRSQLSLQSLMLISEFEFQNTRATMPESLANDGFNLPDSGLYAYIFHQNTPLWRSASSLGRDDPLPPAPATGEERFHSLNFDSEVFFTFSFTAEFENTGQYDEVTFYLIQDKHQFNQEVYQFTLTLWKWLGLLALLLMGLLVFSLLTALRPLSHLIQQLRRIEQGEIHQISQTYPEELEKLKFNINHLLTSEQQQRERYKNSLGDLAHSLKTPLAVLRGMPTLPGAAQEPVTQLDNIIQRQLKRAVINSQQQRTTPQPFKPAVQSLLNAMSKVYADKGLHLTEKIDNSSVFYGDKTDLMELLGNLLDNACKAAKQEVQIQITQSEQHVSIQVEDDGPGIPEQDRQHLLNRGARLDSYQQGQGIGMAVVSDLVIAYNGTLHIGGSELGGARFELRFPIPG